MVYEAGKITYKVVGGILDFFVFLGDSYADVTRQYQWVTGFPQLPPYCISSKVVLLKPETCSNLMDRLPRISPMSLVLRHNGEASRNQNEKYGGEYPG